MGKNHIFFCARCMFQSFSLNFSFHVTLSTLFSPSTKINLIFAAVIFPGDPSWCLSNFGTTQRVSPPLRMEPMNRNYTFALKSLDLTMLTSFHVSALNFGVHKVLRGSSISINFIHLFLYSG